MSILKRILLFLLLPLLPLLLFLLALDFAVLRVAGDSEPIKETLKESGIYTSAIDTFLESTDNPNKDTSGEVSPDNPVVQAAFKKAFSPELIETSSENFIDSIYRWLKGETTVPDFRIDLTQAKTTFIDEVAVGAETRAANLPVCPRGQTEFGDPFSATCLPRGVTPGLAAEKVRAEFSSNENFLKDPVFTASSLKSEKGQQQSAFENSNLPDVYQKLDGSKIVLILLSLLVGAGIIFLSPTLVSGIRRVGIVLSVVGVGVLISTFISNKVVTDMLPELLAKSESPALTEKLQSLIKDIVQNSNKTFSMFGWGYAVTGVGAVLGSFFIKRGKKTETEENTAAKSDPVKPAPTSRSKKA